MTDTEAIAAVSSGGRAVVPLSRHAAEINAGCGYVHQWREIACDSDHDVLECLKCGRQKVCRCTFDDDFA